MKKNQKIKAAHKKLKVFLHCVRRNKLFAFAFKQATYNGITLKEFCFCKAPISPNGFHAKKTFFTLFL